MVHVDIEFEVEASDVESDALRRVVERGIAGSGAPDEATIALVLTGDDRLRELNRRHRGVDAPTDVLSFGASGGEDGVPVLPSEPAHLGDIAVSLETVRGQAAEVGLPFALELHHVVLHGVLHLLGHDHETAEEAAAMESLEEEILGAGVHGGRAAHDDT